ncbi:glycoside hydrolase family 16 protein [Cylindrobasidium torrendii FP15055 ss-10]|uniref:Glycoside hydrolase family 16 protein n=1 Tax=Cylindrobasidium torrendii FP15055 ss-10 TaxID=1314674 RepID=A0A0D7AZN5_9AGAR|nr:glycoside hydrolase family 16 protein [Cylindrobasidium torrendii FP15055 ss-10]
MALPPHSRNESNRHLLGGSNGSHENDFADGPYGTNYSSTSRPNSLAGKFSLGADPRTWGMNVNPNDHDPDDALHTPMMRNGKVVDDDAHWRMSGRGIMNVGCLFIIAMAVLMLFLGYPLLQYAQSKTGSSSTSNLGVNASGQVPVLGNFGLIDEDTPESAYEKTNLRDNSKWTLVFSDEFNTDGRTFYPGEDPYWEAVDMHYWSTNNLEWYDPSAITTENGSLKISLTDTPTHGMDYKGGMMSTWNKFCFTGGQVVTSVRLPGANNVVGLWPAIWVMGNLGRAGYGATLEGTWPYSYDACDVGTAKNQTINGKPTLATTSGLSGSNNELSYLQGQRLSRCTCDGEDHPGPKHSDGTYVGRAAPEIDIFEAQVDATKGGHVSQSGQWAPFNEGYKWDNTSDNLYIRDTTNSELNTYMGGEFQQSTSVVSLTKQGCYQENDGCFAIYGFEYKPGYAADDAYISWINNDQLAWTIEAAGVGADDNVEISARPVPEEPLYLLANLGMSYNFGTVDLENIKFPAIMLIDYIRVYQDPNNINIGCDPDGFPTASYIKKHQEAYNNPNLTTWVDDYKQTIPKNSLVDGC